MRNPEVDYEKGILELLYDYHSDETKKNKRNLVVSCFIVISIYFLNLPLNELKILGVDLSKADEGIALIIALIIIHYWVLMFYLYSRQDIEIHGERKFILDSHIKSLAETKSTLERDDYQNNINFKQQLDGINTALKLYKNQGERLSLVSKLMKLSRSFETIFPIVMFFCASWVLWAKLFLYKC